MPLLFILSLKAVYLNKEVITYKLKSYVYTFRCVNGSYLAMQCSVCTQKSDKCLEYIERKLKTSVWEGVLTIVYKAHIFFMCWGEKLPTVSRGSGAWSPLVTIHHPGSRWASETWKQQNKKKETCNSLNHVFKSYNHDLRESKCVSNPKQHIPI